MTRLHLPGVLVAALLVVHPAAAQKNPSASDILALAGDYVASYAQRVSGVSLEEEYRLLDVTGGRVVATTRVNSDLVLVNVNGHIVGLRDTFAIDTKPTRERSARIATLLAKPTAAAWEQAQGYDSESLRYFQHDLVVRLNRPIEALQFVAAGNQDRSTWKIDGRKKIAGMETVGLRFQETKRKPPKYLLETPQNAIASGRLWVDPTTGRILRTELSMQSDSESARIVVEYAHDAALDLWLPSSMDDRYESTERYGPGLSTQRADNPEIGKRAYECTASYSHARLTPIDMRIVKKP